MDLKGPNNLDPKLKEAYERVMGTSFTPQTPPPLQQTQPIPQPQTNANLPPPPPSPVNIPSNNQAPLQPPPVQPLQVTEELPQPAQPLPPAPPPAQSPQVPSVPEMVQSPQTFSEVNPFNETAAPPGEVLAKNAVVPEKKSGKFILIGLVVGGIIFFVVYAFIWAKVFGLF